MDSGVPPGKTDASRGGMGLCSSKTDVNAYACCTVDFYRVAVNTKESATNKKCLSSSVLGVIPSTDFLKASGVPLSNRGDVIVDKVGARVGIEFLL